MAGDAIEENQLTRTSCHDSGIDIREAVPTVPVIPTKKVGDRAENGTDNKFTILFSGL